MGIFTFLVLSSLLVFASISISRADMLPTIGVCYGQLGDNLPTPSRSIQLIQTLKAKRVKIYDANPQILNALKGTDLEVSVMVPNEIITNISSSQIIADQWIMTNVVPFYPQTMIRYILVGNEILSNQPQTTWFNLVPAMRMISDALERFGLNSIKVGTPLAMDVLESSYPPSSGVFKVDLSEQVLKPLLQFLYSTQSFFFIDVYPYFAWSSQPANINLDYALLAAENVTYTDPGSGLTYTNLLDQMLDAVIFALKRIGYPDIPLFIAETGWPNNGDVDQNGANTYNAATYNRNVVKKFTSNPPVGSPARPGVVLPTFVFSLYNENQKPGPVTERNFGLLYPDGTNLYDIDLSGNTPESKYKPVPKPNPKDSGQVWCVVAEGAKQTDLIAALNYACEQGTGTCDPIQPGGECYQPNTVVGHASYAFSSYWAQFKQTGGTCSFNGLAIQTTQDPSYGSCKFPCTTP